MKFAFLQVKERAPVGSDHSPLMMMSGVSRLGTASDYFDAGLSSTECVSSRSVHAHSTIEIIRE